MNKDIGMLLKQINDKLKITADNSLKESGLTISQTRVMQIIHEKGGEITQKEIEASLQVSHPTVVGIVSRLEKNGYLSCRVDECDRRNKIVSVTDKARQIAKIMYDGRENVEKRLLKGLSDKEVSELRRMLEILYNNMQ